MPTKRKLTRLEGLRLRRELSEAGGAASSSGSGSATTTTTRRTTRSTAAAAVITKVTTPTKATTPTKSSAPTTKPGELRAKGEALARERGGGGSRDAGGPPVTSADSETMTTRGHETNEEGGNFTSPVKDDEGQNDPKDDEDEISVTSPTTTNVVASTLTPTPGYRAELARLQTKISTLETDLRKKNAECASLQSSLDFFMSKGAEQSTHDAVRMYAMGALAMSGGVKGTSPVKASPRRSLVGEMMLEGKVSGDEDDEEEEEEGVVNQVAAAVSRALLVERNNELKKQLSDLTSVNADLRHRISETEERMSNITQRFERANENYQTEKQARKSGLLAKKRVTFSSIATSILIGSDDDDAPTIPPAIDRLISARRKATPRKISSHARAEIGAGAKNNRDKTPCRLLDTGAVRLQMQTNPRKGATNSDRLIDSGAVRVTRFTTPRRLYARRGEIRSPPPPSSSKRLAPLRGNEHIVLATGRYLATATTPSKKSNAHIGGHKFRAAMSPQCSSPIISNVVSYKENDEKSNIGLESDSVTSKRKLF